MDWWIPGRVGLVLWEVLACGDFQGFDKWYFGMVNDVLANESCWGVDRWGGEASTIRPGRTKAHAGPPSYSDLEGLAERVLCGNLL